MKQTINQHDFIDAFRRTGRMATTDNPGGNFSYSALQALFGYLEQYEEDTGQEFELDPVAICCDFAEYAFAQEAAQEMSSWKPDPEEDEETNEAAALEYLRGYTTVIEFDGGVIVESF